MHLLYFKLFHLLGVFALFASLGATLLAGDQRNKAHSILHGVALLIILLAGFALLGKPPAAHWWQVKLGLWLFIGLAPVLAKRKWLPARAVFALTLIAATASAWLGIYKPF